MQAMFLDNHIGHDASASQSLSKQSVWLSSAPMHVPSPQHQRLDGVPPSLPGQSPGQFSQFSPSEQIPSLPEDRTEPWIREAQTGSG